MSNQNAEIVRSIYEAWNLGDLDGALAQMDPAIKIDYSEGTFPGIDDGYEGYEGARKYWRDLGEPWSSLSLEIEQVRENEDKVAIVFTFEGKGRDGIVVRRQAAAVATLVDGLMTRFDAFADRGAALNAAGLSE